MTILQSCLCVRVDVVLLSASPSALCSMPVWLLLLSFLLVKIFHNFCRQLLFHRWQMPPVLQQLAVCIECLEMCSGHFKAFRVCLLIAGGGSSQERLEEEERAGSDEEGREEGAADWQGRRRPAAAARRAPR